MGKTCTISFQIEVSENSDLALHYLQFKFDSMLPVVEQILNLMSNCRYEFTVDYGSLEVTCQTK